LNEVTGGGCTKPDRIAAELAAVEKLQLDNEQRNRLVVQERGYGFALSREAQG
jgi:hypothetical protein